MSTGAPSRCRSKLRSIAAALRLARSPCHDPSRPPSVIDAKVGIAIEAERCLRPHAEAWYLELRGRARLCE